MISVLYGICTIITVIVFIYMAQKNYNSIDIYHWTAVILIPVIVMAYWLKTRISTPETGYFLYCFIYLDSTVLVIVVLFSILHTMGIEAKPWMKIVAYGICFTQMAVVCICANDNLYYKTIVIKKTEMGTATITEYGPLVYIHFIYLGLLIAWMLGIFIVSYIKKGAYARKNLMIYSILIGAALVIYFVEIYFSTKFTMLVFLYTIGDIVIAWRYDRAHKHELSFLIAEQHKRHEQRGYVAVGLNRNFLGMNEKSVDFLPFLERQRVNEKLLCEDEVGESIKRLIDSYEINGEKTTRFETGGMTCVCEIVPFSVSNGGKKQGYLLEVRDATEEQRAYDIIASYNETLNEEVEEKTESIREIQRKIVLGMADMIENRDDNTGGHVKRTSDVINILVDEIRVQGVYTLDEQKMLDIVRAAPTHDLGKISIDNAILNKPGRLTDEEYEIMKTHSAKSGEMVKILLEGVEEDSFVQVAYNVARFHHERWDGKGYPEGLVGEMIPVEARIMAIADVYDALVSKRVYKEPMSFELSAKIMCENMGTQFDPNMESIFLGCREKMEQYYSSF